MPKTKIIFYRDANGTIPLLDWLDKQPDIVQDKCTTVIGSLAEFGYQL
jgi:hypothetical protein